MIRAIKLSGALFLRALVVAYAENAANAGLIVRSPKKALDSIIYYADPGRGIGDSVAGAPLNSSMEA